MKLLDVLWAAEAAGWKRPGGLAMDRISAESMDPEGYARFWGHQGGIHLLRGHLDLFILLEEIWADCDLGTCNDLGGYHDDCEPFVSLTNDVEQVRILSDEKFVMEARESAIDYALKWGS